MSKCKAKTKHTHFPRTSSIPCSRTAWKDGFCKTHHPAEKSRRQRARDGRKEQLFNKAVRRRQREAKTSDFYFSVLPLKTHNAQPYGLMVQVDGGGKKWWAQYYSHADFGSSDTSVPRQHGKSPALALKKLYEWFLEYRPSQLNKQ